MSFRSFSRLSSLKIRRTSNAVAKKDMSAKIDSMTLSTDVEINEIESFVEQKENSYITVISGASYLIGSLSALKQYRSSATVTME